MLTFSHLQFTQRPLVFSTEQTGQESSGLQLLSLPKLNVKWVIIFSDFARIMPDLSHSLFLPSPPIWYHSHHFTSFTFIFSATVEMLCAYIDLLFLSNEHNILGVSALQGYILLLKMGITKLPTEGNRLGHKQHAAVFV